MDEAQYEHRKKLAEASRRSSMEKRMNWIKSKNAGYKIIHKAYNIKKNVIKINEGNTLDHELAKTKIVYLLRKKGFDVFTEVIFTNGKRADVYLPETMEVYEVLASETTSKFKEKIKGYPEELGDIIPFQAEDVLKEDFCI